MTHLTYLCTIDDVVERFPWNFTVDDQFLRRSLVTQVINGNPLLLSDGWIMQHSVARESIRDDNSHLFTLIKEGFVRVLFRGGERYPLHRLPYEIKKAVPSYAWLIEQPFWPDLEKRLILIEGILRSRCLYLNWPQHDTAEGFAKLSQWLVGKTAAEMGLGRRVGRNAPSEFLKRYADIMEKSSKGARSEWEELANAFSTDPDYTGDPISFKANLMRLANEIHHYNMGALLSATMDKKIAVETQASPLFDELVETKTLDLESASDLPIMYVPTRITEASPSKLIDICHPDTKLGEAKQNWLLAKQAYIESAGGSAAKENMTQAGREYSSRLAEHYKDTIRFDPEETAIEWAVSETLSPLVGTISTGAAAFVAAQAGGLVAAAAAGAAVWAGTSFVLYRHRRSFQAYLVERYRVGRLSRALLSPGVVARSKWLVERIRRRALPSVLTLDKERSTDFARSVRLKPFS